MTARAANFVNTWIAVELLAEAASGETVEQITARFQREAMVAGLSADEARDAFSDEDMAKVIAKHAA